MRVLLLDIESKPYTALVWGVRKQYLSSHNLLDTGGILCWCAKWLDEDHTYFDSVDRNGEENMLRNIHAMLEEADAVVTYNGNSFDIPMLNREFLKFGLNPPAPYKSVDVYRVVRSKFRFASNKLDDVLKELGFKGKHPNRGLSLWFECMQGVKSAWKEMETYNTDDVLELENLYLRVLPWITNHPNRSVHDREVKCTNCGSHRFQNRGFARLVSGVYQRYQCNDCGHWMRGSTSIESPLRNRMISVNR